MSLGDIDSVMLFFLMVFMSRYIVYKWIYSYIQLQVATTRNLETYVGGGGDMNALDSQLTPM